MMQLIAETYDLLRRGLGLSDDRLGDVFDLWNQEELNSYLVEITAEIFRKVDDVTGKRLVDVVLDAARQLGTGMWTSQDALSLHVPTPSVDIAVAMRNLSGLEDERAEMARKYETPAQEYQGVRDALIRSARGALYAAMILAYSQGFSQLRAASEAYQYNLDLSTVGRIWRGGCIIRSALLEPIVSAYHNRPNLRHLLLEENLGDAVIKRLADLQHVVHTAVQLSIPVPAFMASLAYFESLRATHLPANLIQAQRDYFGAHTYERVDQRGIFHTQWSQEKE
jgi:6-phosphogluconate dehydrogenase